MSTWVISLLGISVITLICDVILPQGETTKYIKTVISVIVVCSIVFPLVNVVTDFDIGNLLSTSQPIYQQSYLDYVKVEKQTSLESTCNTLFAENGLKGCCATVVLDNDLLPESVCVAVEKAYYNQATVDKITKVVLSVVNVGKSGVNCVVKD